MSNIQSPWMKGTTFKSWVLASNQVSEKDSAASCGVLNHPLRGIVQLTNSATLRFRNWSFNNKKWDLHEKASQTY